MEKLRDGELAEKLKDKEMELQHDNQEHPLIHHRRRRGRKPVACSVCRDHRTFRCKKGEDYVLHESCAKLESKISHPTHRRHPLVLQKRELKNTCDACQRECQDRMIYRCSECDFDLDLQCASIRRNIEIDCQQHNFTLLPKKIESFCDICGQYGVGLYYFCNICQLLVDEECTALPHQVKLAVDDHPLELTWFLEDIDSSKHFCALCYQNMKRSCGVYYCKICRYVAHTRCVTKSTQVAILDDEFIHIGDDVAPATVDNNDHIDHRQGQLRNMVANDDDQIKLAARTKHFSHPQHVLALHEYDDQEDQVGVDSNNILSCNGCMQLITNGGYYACAECCPFLLHKACAQFPPTKNYPFHQHKLTLSVAPSVDNIFECYMCKTLSQGFAYNCRECNFYLDLHCISVFDRPLTHEAHKHQLFANREKTGGSCWSCHDSRNLNDFRFSCVKQDCTFHLCISCVKMPLIAKYKKHNHPLKLTFRSAENDPGGYYCDTCEGERDPKHWFYNCKECELECHPDCVLGSFPQVKSGSTTYILETHPHPVSLVEKRKSVIPFDKRDNILPCEACAQPCQGLVFECSVCSRNIHRLGCCVDPTTYKMPYGLVLEPYNLHYQQPAVNPPFYPPPHYYQQPGVKVSHAAQLQADANSCCIQ